VHTIHWLSRKANELGVPLVYYFDINNPQNHLTSNTVVKNSTTSNKQTSQSIAQGAKETSASSTAALADTTTGVSVPYCTTDSSTTTTTTSSLNSTQPIHSLSVIVTNNSNNRIGIEGNYLPASSSYSSTQSAAASADPYYSHFSSPNENAASPKKLSGCLLKKKYINSGSLNNSNISTHTNLNEKNTSLSNECQEMSFIYRSYNQHHQNQQHISSQQYVDVNESKYDHTAKDRDTVDYQQLRHPNSADNNLPSRKANETDAGNSIQVNVVNSTNKNGSTSNKNASTNYSQIQSPRCLSNDENNSSNYHVNKTVNRNSQHDDFELIDSTVSPISTNSATSPHLMSSSSSNANTTNCSSSVCNSNTNLNNSTCGGGLNANGTVQVIPTRFIDRRVSTSLIQSDPYKFNVNYFEAGQRLAKKAQEQLKSLEKIKDSKTSSK
jgi:hypothetical protein